MNCLSIFCLVLEFVTKPTSCGNKMGKDSLSLMIAHVLVPGICLDRTPDL